MSSNREIIKLLEEQIRSYTLLIKINKWLRYVGLGSKQLAKYETEIENFENDLYDLKELPRQFNAVFSERGWITYDGMNVDFVKEVLKTYKEKGIDDAEGKLIENYRPEKLNFEITRLNAAPAIKRRLRFVNLALEDYNNGRYYSVIPLLLMVIDGAINETVGKGFHSEQSELDAWDSITNIDGGIYQIKNIFKKGRYKTNDAAISMPYRNGILHGLELGYDNIIVAAKCWHFLFVIRDWISAKNSESARKEKYAIDRDPPPISDSIRKLADTKKLKNALAQWTPREISASYLASIENNLPNDKSLPETILIEFLNFWLERNYGFMSQYYSSLFSKNGKPDIMRVKNQFARININSYRLIEIIDESAGISEIKIDVVLDEKKKPMKARLLYEDSNGQVLPRNINTGSWKIVGVQDI